MATMGRYCKAYPVLTLREFSGWKENLQNLRKEKSPAGLPTKASAGRMPKKMSPGEAPPVEAPRALSDDDHLYLQENFTVTDGIFIDENIVFDSDTPEWLDYCKNTLMFEVPNYETAQAQSSVS